MSNFEGENISVIISHINDPFDFYVLRLKNILITKEVSAIIKALLEKNPSLMKNVDEENIDICRTNSILVIEEFGILYRIQINSTDTANKNCSVYFVDIGKIQDVSIDRIRALDKKVFSSVPGPFLFHCKLSLGAPLRGQWSKESIDAFKALTGTNHLTMHVLARVGTKYTCDLYRLNCHVNFEIVLMGFCPFTSPPGVYFTSKVMIQFYKPLSLTVGEMEKVYIVNFKSIDSFLVTKQSLDINFVSVTKDLCTEYRQEKFEGSYNFVMPRSCVACKYNTELEKNVWLRGLIVQVKRRNMTAIVYLVDKGIVTNVDFEDLRPLKQKFLVLEALVARCRMTADCFLAEDKVKKLKSNLRLTKGLLTLVEPLNDVRVVASVKLTIPD